jgi:hypothetical protein
MGFLRKAAPENQITLDTILGQFRAGVPSNRDLGDRFERMIQQFLRADPLYAALFMEGG